MNNTTYPGSETDNETYENWDFQSTASNDFIDQWVNLTVEKEVLRGTKVREVKLKSCPQREDYEVVNIDLMNSPCSEENSYSKNGTPGRCNPKLSPSSSRPRTNSMYIRQNLASRGYIPGLKAKCVQRCPMRIAELAVPTKRQCIDTWRNKCDVLPAFMVERLRQQVMDEKPVIQVADAITCFTKRKPKSRKSTSKRSNMQNHRTKQDDKRIAEIEKLCAEFAKRIAQKLIKPQNLNLNPELDKLAKVVANEMIKIIQNRKKFNVDDNMNRKIHADISAKISVWIATILEESSYKLLEEDLRELDEEEGPVLDFIDHLIQNVLTICEPEPIAVKESEEEEEEEDVNSETVSKASEENNDSSNALLDYNKDNEIDTSTLFTNGTLDIEDRTIDKTQEYKPIDSETKNRGVEELVDETLEPRNESEGTELNVNEHIKGELDRILELIDVATADIESENNVHEKVEVITNEDVDSKNGLLPKDELTNNADDTSELDNRISVVQSLAAVALTDNTDSNIRHEVEDNKSNEFVQSEDENVSDSFELFDEALDEKNKKVKFSETNMGIRGSTGKLDEGSGKQQEGGKHYGIPKISWNHSTESFRPPNEHLLSDADESWPEDMVTPVLKPSASASRSITSLGRIVENDEKLLLSDDEIRSKSSLEGLQQREEELLSGKQQNKNKIYENVLINIEGLTEELQRIKNEREAVDEKPMLMESQEDQESGPQALESSIVPIQVQDIEVEIDVRAPTGSEELRTEQNDLNFKELIKEDSSFLNIPDSKINYSQSQLSKLNESAMKSNDVKNLANVKYEGVQQKHKAPYSMSGSKFDYKVHPKTAPLWLRRDHGKGEPTEESIRGKFLDSDIRRWCKDLDRMFANLEMGNNWVDTSCKNIINLKHKREINSLFAPNAIKQDARDLAMLKKEIAKDTILWTKLNQRAYEKLKIYQEKAKIISAEYRTVCDCKNITKVKKSNL